MVKPGRSEELKEVLLSVENSENEKWVQKSLDELNDKNTAFDKLKLGLTVISPLLTNFLPEQLNIFR